MADSTYKPKVTSAPSADPALSKTTLDYMKLIEQMNEARVKKLQVIAKRNRITALTIGAGVFGIYLYSIFAVKQETFLDDFNEPAKTLKE